MADDVVAVTAFVCRATDDVFIRTIMADHVERDGREVVHLVAEVAGDRERLEKNLGHDDGRTDIQDNATFELGDDGGELLKIKVRRFAEYAAICRRVLMDDVRADGNVDGGGNLADDTLVQDAQLTVAELAGDDGFPERAARAEARSEERRVG